VNQRKLAQYKGRLTPSEVAAGMNAAQANARRLVHDAKLLLDSDRLPSAVALAVLSIEESGKLSILRGLAVAKSDEQVKNAWREYRTHTAKNRLWSAFELIKNGARKLDDFASLVSGDANHPTLLDQLKQLALYTDCLGERHWSKPDVVITREIATALVRTAELLARGHDISPREMELWIQHIQPIWMGRKELMEKALVDWHGAMHAEGLTSDGPDEMEKFIIQGYDP
jgi:AbiV family abortive infection protein